MPLDLLSGLLYDRATTLSGRRTKINYLQLCQATYLEGGLSGQITATQNQTGEAARVVHWVSNAYQEILNDQALNWNFLRKTVAVQLTAGKQDYTLAELNLSTGVQWNTKAMRVAINSDLSDETFVEHMRYPTFRDYWLFSSRRTTQSRPLNATVSPENKLLVAPIPAADYWLDMEYLINPPKLIEPADVPVFPERFHMAIVWKALRHYGMFEAAGEVVARADTAYHSIMLQMEMDQGFEVVVGDPIC